MTFRRGFTIVELLIVIVVIGVLAAITIVSYSNISQNAITDSIKTDLTNFRKTLEVSRTSSATDVYPDTAALAGLKPSNGATLTYNYVSGSKHYCLEETLAGVTYSITNINNTVTQSQCIYNGILGWWKFNGDATDSSGNGINGTVNGALLANGYNGNANSSYQLGNSNMCISMGNPSIYSTLGTSGFSYSIWVKRTANSVSRWPQIMGAYDTHIYFGIRSGNYGDGIYFEYGIPPYNGLIFDGIGYNSTNLPVNVWKHAVATYDSSTLKFYLDGVLITTKTSITLNTSFGSLGMTTITNGFEGFVDDSRIYNRALSNTEVVQIFSQGAQ